MHLRHPGRDAQEILRDALKACEPADAAVFWDSATMYSKYIPGAVVYSVKSIPDLIEDLEQLAGTAISNRVAYANLVSGLLYSCSQQDPPCMLHNFKEHACMEEVCWPTACAADNTFVHFTLVLKVCRVQSSTYSQVFHVLSKAINPTITGLALRLAFHDAGTYDLSSTKGKGG